MNNSDLPIQLRVRRDAMMSYLYHLLQAAKADPALKPELDAATIEMDDINNAIDRIRRQRQEAA